MNQWYNLDEDLYKIEIESMSRVCSEARYGFLQDTSMYWSIPIHTRYRKWTILITYDCDYKQLPHNDFFGIRVYPLEPIYEKMEELVDNSRVHGATIPNTYRDHNGNVCLSVITAQMVNNENNRCFTAAGWIPYIER